jgi:ferredoxin
MSKAHRGKGIRELFAHGRGSCPVCSRNNVKILYEQDAGDKKIKICKTCRAAVKHGKKSLPAVSAPPQEEKAADSAAPAAE